MRKRSGSLRKRKKQQSSRPFSVAFMIAIPSNFIFAGMIILSLVHLGRFSYGRGEVWALFASGALCALVLVGTSHISRLRVLVHEIKHAVVVVLTGNGLRDIEVNTHTGHVKFDMYKDRIRFAPIIYLAPYFFPLFSLPTLLVCLVLDIQYLQLSAMLLGAMLASDISMAYTDLHPHQSDLQKVPGGPFIGLLYLAGVHLLWVSVCLLWVMGGRKAYVHAMYFSATLLKQLAETIAK